jgi:hypothetical protein
VAALAACSAPGAPSPPDPCQDAPYLCAPGRGTCNGVCAPPFPGGPDGGTWFAPFRVWIGPSTTMLPACPPDTPLAETGYADTEPSLTCAPCSCIAPPSTCDLSKEEVSPQAGVCPGDPPAFLYMDWDGTCSTAHAVSSAGSVYVAPPIITPGFGCEELYNPPISADGPTRAQLCEASGNQLSQGLNPGGVCEDPEQTCVFPKADGYLTCIISDVSLQAEDTCPDGWPVKHVWYNDVDLCGCPCNPEAPVGSCSTTVTVYTDGACSNPLLSVSVSSDQAGVCMDVVQSSAVGSMSATPVVYHPGPCNTMLVKELAQTLCCLP